MRLTIEKLQGLVAQAWCTKRNSHKEMDADLANAIVALVADAYEQVGRPSIHEPEKIIKDNPDTKIEPSGEVVIPSFRDRLESLMYSHSMEDNSDTPQHILADYLYECLQAFNKAVNRRNWHFSNRNKKD